MFAFWRSTTPHLYIFSKIHLPQVSQIIDLGNKRNIIINHCYASEMIFFVRNWKFNRNVWGRIRRWHNNWKWSSKPTENCKSYRTEKKIDKGYNYIENNSASDHRNNIVNFFFIKSLKHYTNLGGKSVWRDRQMNLLLQSYWPTLRIK